MTNEEKFIETFGDVLNFRLEMIGEETEIKYNFIAFLQDWWNSEYKEIKK